MGCERGLFFGLVEAFWLLEEVDADVFGVGDHVWGTAWWDVTLEVCPGAW